MIHKAVALLILLCWSIPSLAQQAIRLDRAEFVASDALTPPTEGWRMVSLPDNWRLTHPRLSGYAWYRLRFTLPSRPDQPLALYLPHLALSGELRLNGSLLNPDVRFDMPGRMGTPMNDTPLYLVLPSALFRAGENVLTVRLQGNRLVRSGLSTVEIGPPDTLHGNWMPRYALQVIAPYLILVLMGGALCFLLAYAWHQRRAYTIQFALLTGVLAAASYLAVQLPLTRGVEQAVRVWITTVMYWFLCVAGYRLSGARVRWLLPMVHVCSALCLLASLAWALLGAVSDQVWMLTWPQIPLRLAVAVLLLRQGWRLHSLTYMALALTAMLWIATMVQSYLILMEALPWDSFRLSVAGGLPFCIAVLFYFAERFVVDREESLLQQRAAITAERERILQDMHDGMGAQLITALRLARRDDVDRIELARSIEESLQDLRLIIDSLDLAERDLLPLLGNLRFRLEPRLNTLGIALEWDVLPLPELDYLTPETALAILRIVQEAINNAIQHALPRYIRISVKPADEGIAIEIADDGRGFESHSESARPGSRGLAGMQQRAAKLNARLELHSDAAGTRVRLLLQRIQLPL